MTPTTAPTPRSDKPDYGVDAPSVLRNLFLCGGLCLLAAIFLPRRLHLGSVVILSRSFFWPAGFLLAEASLFLLYVKVGKFRHRDMMLALISWRGDEQVLDVGCGRGLLLAGAAKRLAALNGSGHVTGPGHATGIDLWSNVDMGANSPEATLHNLTLEGLANRATVLSLPAQDMTFPDGYFNVILSNLCLHNIPNSAVRRAAVEQIARVLAPGGTALISDYRRTGDYARIFRQAGLAVTTKRGSFLTTFPPLNVVIARKPL